MFSLRIKLFLTILLASALLIISLLTLAQWNFERGFGDYLERQQIQRLQNIAAILGGEYEQHQQWDERYLARLEHRLPEPRPDFPPHQERSHHQTDHFDDKPPRPRRNHLFVLDLNQQPWVGKFDAAQDNALQPITVNGEIVGFVGQARHRAPQEFLDKEFARHQTEHLLLLASLAGVVSLLVAFPLASLLVRRIKQLLLHIQALSKGDFAAKIIIHGSDELSQLGLHLNALGQTLQRNALSHRNMVADISHELRTPITVLQAQLEAIEDGIQPLTASTLQRLQQQVSRLANLVNDLYQLSLADVGALTYRKELLNVRGLLHDLVQDFAPRLQQANLEWQVEDDSSDPLIVLGDPQRLSQLFGNLLQNSCQYTQAPGKVIVQIHKKTNQAVIIINDSAPGVAPDLQPQLFERLFRAENSRNRNSGGAGLGLSLCRTITQAHGGEISVSDSPIGGIAVTVSLPLAAH